MAQESIRCYSGDKLMCNGKNTGNLVYNVFRVLWAKQISPYQNSPPSDTAFNSFWYSVQSRLHNEYHYHKEIRFQECFISAVIFSINQVVWTTLWYKIRKYISGYSWVTNLRHKSVDLGAPGVNKLSYLLRHRHVERVTYLHGGS